MEGGIFIRPLSLFDDVFTPEGEPRTVGRERVRRTVIRIRASDPAMRSRMAVRPLHHTGDG